MLVASHVPLGGFKEDAIDVLGPILGRDRVLSFVNGLEAEIRRQAEAGARRAIPDIELAVDTQAAETVRPFFIGAMIAGSIGGLLGAWALWRTRK